jgi:hypothetical protein
MPPRIKKISPRPNEPDEWRISREYIHLYRTKGMNNCKLGSAVIYNGKVYEAFIIVKERDK